MCLHELIDIYIYVLPDGPTIRSMKKTYISSVTLYVNIISYVLKDVQLHPMAMETIGDYWLSPKRPSRFETTILSNRVQAVRFDRNLASQV